MLPIFLPARNIVISRSMPGGRGATAGDPKGAGGGGRSTDIEMVVWVDGFCGRRRFSFRHMAWGEVLFSPHVFSHSKCCAICGESKMDEKHKNL